LAAISPFRPFATLQLHNGGRHGVLGSRCRYLQIMLLWPTRINLGPKVCKELPPTQITGKLVAIPPLSAIPLALSGKLVELQVCSLLIYLVENLLLMSKCGKSLN